MQTLPPMPSHFSTPEQPKGADAAPGLLRRFSDGVRGLIQPKGENSLGRLLPEGPGAAGFTNKFLRMGIENGTIGADLRALSPAQFLDLVRQTRHLMAGTEKELAGFRAAMTRELNDRNFGAQVVGYADKIANDEYLNAARMPETGNQSSTTTQPLVAMKADVMPPLN